MFGFKSRGWIDPLVGLPILAGAVLAAVGLMSARPRVPMLTSSGVATAPRSLASTRYPGNDPALAATSFTVFLRDATDPPATPAVPIASPPISIRSSLTSTTLAVEFAR